MDVTLGFGLEDQTKKEKEHGNGKMEVSGSSPSGQMSQPSSQTISNQITTVSRYMEAHLPQTDGTTTNVHFSVGSFAAGKFGQVVKNIPWDLPTVNFLLDECPNISDTFLPTG